MNSKPTNISAVLLYHRMGIPRLSSTVAGQYVLGGVLTSGLRYLVRRGWDPISLDSMIAKPHSKQEDIGNRFAVTFDDGYQSVFNIALPILKSMGVPATIYIVAGEIGGINRWDHELGDCLEPMMTSRQIIEASEMGFEIGSHTSTHRRLTQLSNKELEREMTDSKHILEDLLGKKVRSVSYPYGDCNGRVVQAAIETGYEYAASTIKTTFSENSDPFLIPRVNVRYDGIGTILMRKILRSYRAAGE